MDYIPHAWEICSWVHASVTIVALTSSMVPLSVTLLESENWLCALDFLWWSVKFVMQIILMYTFYTTKHEESVACFVWIGIRYSYNMVHTWSRKTIDCTWHVVEYKKISEIQRLYAKGVRLIFGKTCLLSTTCHLGVMPFRNVDGVLDITIYHVAIW
jgi:hypothetical protein